MTHHTDQAVQPRNPDGGGLEVEKWILRALVLALLAVTTAAVVGSLDDIKRYVRMSRM